MTLNLGGGKKKHKIKEQYAIVTLDLVKPTSKKYTTFDYESDIRPKLFDDESSGEDERFHDKEAREMVRRLEEKYGTAYSKKGKKKKKIFNEDDFMNKGMGYDLEDKFIDDSEAYDELIPSTMDTLKGGFYVNKGKLEFRSKEEDEEDISDESEVDEANGKKTNAPIENEKKRKARISSSSSSGDESAVEKDKESEKKQKQKKPTEERQRLSGAPPTKRAMPPPVLSLSDPQTTAKTNQPKRRLLGAPPTLPKKMKTNSESGHVKSAASSDGPLTSAASPSEASDDDVQIVENADNNTSGNAESPSATTAKTTAAVHNSTGDKPVQSPAKESLSLVSTQQPLPSSSTSAVAPKKPAVPASQKLLLMVRNFESIVTEAKRTNMLKKKVDRCFIEHVVRIEEECSNQGMAKSQRHAILESLANLLGIQKAALLLRIKAIREEAQQKNTERAAEKAPAAAPSASPSSALNWSQPQLDQATSIIEMLKKQGISVQQIAQLVASNGNVQISFEQFISSAEKLHQQTTAKQQAIAQTAVNGKKSLGPPPPPAPSSMATSQPQPKKSLAPPPPPASSSMATSQPQPTTSSMLKNPISSTSAFVKMAEDKIKLREEMKKVVEEAKTQISFLVRALQQAIDEALKMNKPEQGERKTFQWTETARAYLLQIVSFGFKLLASKLSHVYVFIEDLVHPCFRGSISLSKLIREVTSIVPGVDGLRQLPWYNLAMVGDASADVTKGLAKQPPAVPVSTKSAPSAPSSSKATAIVASSKGESSTSKAATSVQLKPSSSSVTVPSKSNLPATSVPSTSGLPGLYNLLPSASTASSADIQKLNAALLGAQIQQLVQLQMQDKMKKMEEDRRKERDELQKRELAVRVMQEKIEETEKKLAEKEKRRAEKEEARQREKEEKEEARQREKEEKEETKRKAAEDKRRMQEEEKSRKEMERIKKVEEERARKEQLKREEAERKAREEAERVRIEEEKRRKEEEFRLNKEREERAAEAEKLRLQLKEEEERALSSLMADDEVAEREEDDYLDVAPSHRHDHLSPISSSLSFRNRQIKDEAVEAERETSAAEKERQLQLAAARAAAREREEQNTRRALLAAEQKRLNEEMMKERQRQMDEIQRRHREEEERRRRLESEKIKAEKEHQRQREDGMRRQEEEMRIREEEERKRMAREEDIRRMQQEMTMAQQAHAPSVPFASSLRLGYSPVQQQLPQQYHHASPQKPLTPPYRTVPHSPLAASPLASSPSSAPLMRVASSGQFVLQQTTSSISHAPYQLSGNGLHQQQPVSPYSEVSSPLTQQRESFVASQFRHQMGPSESSTTGSPLNSLQARQMELLRQQNLIMQRQQERQLQPPQLDGVQLNGQNGVGEAGGLPSQLFFHSQTQHDTHGYY